MATCPNCRERYADDTLRCPKDGDTLLPDAAFAGSDDLLKPGDSVGEYRIASELGKGGFGSVYRAVHPLIGKAVAVKVLSRQFSSNPHIVSRFIAEARSVNQIRHRNIVDIFSFGVLGDGRHYFVMELLEGVTLRKFLTERGRLSPSVALPILQDVAAALDAAHQQGIAHRDLKPDNVFLVFDRDVRTSAKLIDFGIAKLLDPTPGAPQLTNTGMPLGTPGYMSPEQCHGSKVDARTDIYSLGVVAHELLSGQKLFQANDAMALMLQHLNAAPPRLSEVAPDLSPELDLPVQHMLRKAPEGRPPSAGVAIAELGRAAQRAGYAVDLASPSRTSSVSVIPPAPHSSTARTFQGSSSEVPEASGRKAALAVGACALAALIAGGVWLRTASQPAITPPLSVVAPPSVTGAQPVSAVAQVSVATPAPLPSDVEIRIQSTPAVVDVLLRGKKIGSSAAPVRISRSESPLTLTVAAAGYQPAAVQVTPSADGVVSVTLNKAAFRAHGKRGVSELENPF